MAKSKKVTIASVEDVMNDYFPNSEVVEWHGIEIQIQRNISVSDVIGFVSDVIDCCFSEDGEYHPEMYSFAIRSNTIMRYTNVTMSSNLKDRYMMLYRTGLYDFVCQYINRDQLSDIEIACSNKISQMCDSDITASRNALRDLLAKMDEVADNLSNMFSGVSPEDLGRLLQATYSGGIDENKLVRAFAGSASGEN